MSKSKAPLDVAPPYRAVALHEASPKANHDEAARFDFLANFNKFRSGSLGQGNGLTYKKEVLPAFIKQHGRSMVLRQLDDLDAKPGISAGRCKR